MTNTNFSQAQSAPTTASADTHQTIDELVFELSNSTPVVAVDVLAQYGHAAAVEGSKVTPKNPSSSSANQAAQAFNRFTPKLIPNYTCGQVFKKGEVGCAERVAAFFGDRLKFDATQQNWMFWSGKRWERDQVGGIVECVKTVASHICDVEAPAMHALSQAPGDYHALQAKDLREMGNRLHNKVTIYATVELARTIPALAVKHSDFDADPFLLNTLDGTVDLGDMSLRKHDRADLLTSITPIPMADSSDGCPRWKQFLLEVMQGDTEMVNYLQRMVGYCLTGNTQEQVFFLLHGHGANGKSVFLNILQRLLGEYSKVADFTTFLDTNRGNAPRIDLASFVGKRLVVASESAQGKQLDEAVLKSFTGGDVITARELYKSFFEFKPVSKVVLATNHKPKIQGTDYGIWRRMRLIPFLASFPEDKRDSKLEAKLTAELPAILRWAVEGCFEWQKHGLGMPKAVKDAVEEYQSSQDTFQIFLDTTCERDSNAQESSQKLFDAYKLWATNSGMRSPMMQVTFNNTLKDRGIQHKKTNRGNVWVGLKLKSTVDSSVAGGELCFE